MYDFNHSFTTTKVFTGAFTKNIRIFSFLQELGSPSKVYDEKLLFTGMNLATEFLNYTNLFFNNILSENLFGVS